MVKIKSGSSFPAIEWLHMMEQSEVIREVCGAKNGCWLTNIKFSSNQELKTRMYDHTAKIPEEYVYEVDEQDYVLGPVPRSIIHLPPFPIHRSNSIIAVTPGQQI